MKKKQKQRSKPTKLWQTLEAIPGLAAVKAEWQSLLNDEWAATARLLRAQPNLATSYPRLERSHAGLPLRVVDHGGGRFVGVCDETGESVGLCRDDLVVYGLDHRKFSEIAAAAIDLSPAIVGAGKIHMPLILGYTSAADAQIPVLFVSPRDSSEFYGDVTSWISEQSRLCVWLTATRRFWTPRVEHTIHSSQCGLFALQDLIEIDDVGNWTRRSTASQVAGFGAKALASRSLSKRAQTGDVRTVYLHYHAGQKLYVCVVNEQKAPFDFSVNQFRSVDQLANHQDACLPAESRMDQRADFGCSYSARIDLSRLAAELDNNAASSEVPMFSVHWLVQIGDEPQLREDTVLRDSCRVRYVCGRFAAVDTSSEEMFDEELTFAKKQKWLDERREFRTELIEQREELSSRLLHAAQNANVGEVLRVFAASVMQWARGLKRHLFDHFYLDAKDPLFCRMYQVPPSSGIEFHPFWITEPWIGMHEAYDLLEFHKSPEFAKSLAARVQTLLNARLAYSARIVEETARHDRDLDIETFVGIDEERKDLRHIAFSLCEHLNLLASQFDAIRNGGPLDRAVPAATPVSDQTDVVDTPPTPRTWPEPQDHTVAKLWTRKDGVLCLSTKTDSSHDGVVEFAPLVPGELTYQMRFMQFMSFTYPSTATLAQIIEQVYPNEYVEARRDPTTLKNTLRRLRSLVSDIRTKKLGKAGINPEILPSLNIEASIQTGIGLQLAKLHRLDDKELDQADAAPI